MFGENGEFEPSAFSTLVTKLQSCLGQLEHFPVKVSANNVYFVLQTLSVGVGVRQPLSVGAQCTDYC